MVVIVISWVRTRKLKRCSWLMKTRVVMIVQLIRSTLCIWNLVAQNNQKRHSQNLYWSFSVWTLHTLPLFYSGFPFLLAACIFPIIFSWFCALQLDISSILIYFYAWILVFIKILSFMKSSRLQNRRPWRHAVNCV